MGQLRQGLSRRFQLIAVGAVTAGLVLLAVGAASAQSLSGGCQATAGGKTVPSMTRDDPLVLSKGKRIRVNASVPAANREATTQLKVKLGFVSKSYSFKGTSYNKNFAPPSWVFTAVDGVVKFSGSATGDGFSCEGDGYVKIDGDGLLSILGGAVLTGAGAAGAASSSKPKPPPTPDNPQKAKDKLNLGEVIKDLKREMGKDFAISLVMLIILIFFLLLFGG